MNKHFSLLPMAILSLFLFLSLSLTSALDTPIGDCLTCCELLIQETETPKEEDIQFKWGYNISVPMKTFCQHDSLFNFQVSYDLGTGDADSSFSMSYYEMIIDATGICVSDPLNDSGTLTASTEYSTITEDGASTDPCGYYIEL